MARGMNSNNDDDTQAREIKPKTKKITLNVSLEHYDKPSKMNLCIETYKD